MFSLGNSAANRIGTHSWSLTLKALVALTVLAGGLSLGCTPDRPTSNWPDHVKDVPVGESIDWSFEYDDQDRVIAKIDPSGRKTTYRYESDPSGGLRSVTVRAPEGDETTWTFDSGRLVAMRDRSGRTEYRYDARGRLQAVLQDGQPEIMYVRDTAGNVTELKVGDSYHVRWQRDFLGYLSAVDTPAGAIRYYQTSDGGEVRDLPNGIRTIRYFDAGGHLLSMQFGQIDPTDSGRSTPLYQASYKYYPSGKISEIEEGSSGGKHNKKKFGYGKNGKLTSVVEANGGTSKYEHDKRGNRTSASGPNGGFKATYNWNGSLKGLNGRPVGHDKNGNITSLNLSGGPLTFHYLSNGKLAGVSVGGKEISYLYDGAGRMTDRIGPSGRTHFTLDPTSKAWKPLLISDSKGGKTSVIWDGDKPLALTHDGKTNWILPDHVGSPLFVTDDKGAISEAMGFDSFGAPTETRASGFAVGFGGMFRDPDAGIEFAGDRTYLPEVQSFLQPDPANQLPAFSSPIDPYDWAHGDPINLVSRTGSSVDPAEARENLMEKMQEIKEAQMDAKEHLLDVQSQMRERINDMRENQSQTLEQIHDQQEASRDARERAEGVSDEIRTGTIELRNGILASEFRALAVSDLNMVRELTTVLSLPEGPIIAGMAQGAGRAIAEDEAAKSPAYGASLEGENAGADKARSLFATARRTYNLFSGPPPDLSFDATVQIVFKSLHNFAVRAVSSLAAQNIISDLLVGGAAYADEIPPAHSPSPVGGVYLGGAGKLLQNFGEIEGADLDENGGLILLGRKSGNLSLPPMRLDDVVTVFRSVYQQGEGPHVTIDPNPKNPQGPIMIVKHGDSTVATYVGWVLYEADRLMKTYQLGEDNVTKQPISTKVPGYDELEKQVFFDPDARRGTSIWQRFWIVPAEIDRFPGRRRRLTLFDIKLKVRTQRMRWAGDHLEDDTTAGPSAGAQAFSTWFTKNYDAIAAERMMTPPPETGITHPVPVFQELRRIALLTAVAEALRDQRVPMPFWMRDYPVQPVKIDETTPTIRPQKAADGRIAQIFGGVSLSSEPSGVRTITREAASGVQAVRANESAHMEDVIAARPAGGSGPEPYTLASLPGTETKQLGANRVEDADIVLTIPGGTDIRLVRRFNSFFAPRGPWGSPWTQDLPRLEPIRVPIERHGDSTLFQTAYELVCPLNSSYARFSRQGVVPELNGSTLIVPDQPGPYLGIATGKLDVVKPAETNMVILGNGSEWHFAKDGSLIAIREGAQLTVYERDRMGQVTSIDGTVGGALKGRIRLSYDKDGRITDAVGTSTLLGEDRSVTVRYGYDRARQLEKVEAGQGELGLTYKGSFVASKTWKPKDGKPALVAAYEYDDAGRLTAETRNGVRVSNTIRATASGYEYASSDDSSVEKYDRGMRLLEQIKADGARSKLTYSASGDKAKSTTFRDGSQVRVSESNGGRTKTLTGSGLTPLKASFDSGGRLTEVKDPAGSLVRQEWGQNGMLQRIEGPDRQCNFEYDSAGKLKRALVFPPDSTGSASVWREITFDPEGNIKTVRDSHGLDVALQFDRAGKLVAADQKTASVKVTQDSGTTTTTTSWDGATYTVASGRTHTITVERDGKKATTEISASGRLLTVGGFGDSVIRFHYRNVGKRKNALWDASLPSGLTLQYDYDASDRLNSVTVGPDCRVLLEFDAKGRVVGRHWTELLSASH